MKPIIRIKKLFHLAKGALDPHRYLELARRISTRTRTRIPTELKRKICKGCGSLMDPGRVRIKHGQIHVTCQECKKKHVFPFKPQE